MPVFLTRYSTISNGRLVLGLQAKAALEAGGVCDGPAKLRPELDMLKLVSQGVEMDVLLVRNVAEGARQGVDRAQVQRDLLVGPLFHMTDDEIAAMAQQTPDRAQERGVVEALTRFVREQHTTANQAVRLFKVGRGPSIPGGLAVPRPLTLLQALSQCTCRSDRVGPYRTTDPYTLFPYPIRPGIYASRPCCNDTLGKNQPGMDTHDRRE